MQFAIAMTLVVLLSTIVLLYQFWTGSHLSEPDAGGFGARYRAREPERDAEPPLTLPAYRADSAA
jgi:hypothetical protein